MGAPHFGEYQAISLSGADQMWYSEMAFVSSASRGNNPVKGRARSLFIPDRNYSLTKYLADTDGGSKRILPSRQTAGAEFPEYAGK
jgi:hypothetical protein